MQLIKKILHIKLTIITIILLPIVVLLLLTSRNEVMGYRSFVVLTGSMTPTIPQGSVIITKRDTLYTPGQIIAFEKEGRTITHRIIDVTKDKKYVTMGDANKVADSSPVAPRDVIGQTVFHVPYVGNFILFLQTLPGFIAFIIIPGILFIGFELWTIKHHIERETEKKLMKKMSQNGDNS